ncbi:hypothetical protein BD847_2140 [Flavobacterium cutihirudinis]|uniref:DUF7683 domain-containing protein n=1 Tax=Flavobacterium cutihirudinis TaxID=1265740 RepID=A0A3D9FX70_9FLAO|nr:hypothetical protein [Flavobacterium cutihirudinis]RED25389.1 hypothetical protein BD847_2140 [Flavobacterium cutihirudinis]
MNIVREIVAYQKEGDKFIDSVEIDLSIEKLIEILNVNIEDDPGVYLVYEIDKKQFFKLLELAPELSKINFDEGAIYYECSEIK